MLRPAVLLLFPAVAAATPVTVAWQARLLDTSGDALAGSHALHVGLWSALEDGTRLHDENLGSVVVQDGYVSAMLGSGGNLQHTAFSSGAVWVEVVVDGVPLSPRQALAFAPFAASSLGELGLSPRSPAASCYALAQADPDLPTGRYWVDPNGGSSSDAFEAWCDMDVDGGGWTLVMQGRPVAYDSANLCVTGAVGSLTLDDANVNGPAKLSNTVINALFATAPEREVLYKGDDLNYNGVAPFGVWEYTCRFDLRDDYTFHLGQHAVSDLENTTVTCTGLSSFSVLTVGNNAAADTCGWQFQNGSSGRYIIFSAPPTYNAAPCTGATAGRSWAGGSPNQGCHTSKMYVR